MIAEENSKEQSHVANKFVAKHTFVSILSSVVYDCVDENVSQYTCKWFVSLAPDNRELLNWSITILYRHLESHSALGWIFLM